MSKLFKRGWRNRGRTGAFGQIAYVFALIGGIIIILLSIAALLNFSVSIPFHSPLAGYFGIGIISLILGVIAVFGSKRAHELIWAIVLMIVGYVGGGIGGLLVLLGGLIGLLSRYI